MLHTIAKGCGMNSGTGFSRAVELRGDNACQLDVAVFAFTGGSGENLSLTLEGSNDGENWSSAGITGSAISFAGGATPEIGCKTGRFTGIAWRYVRARYTLGGTSKQATFACVLNTQAL